MHILLERTTHKELLAACPRPRPGSRWRLGAEADSPLYDVVSVALPVGILHHQLLALTEEPSLGLALVIYRAAGGDGLTFVRYASEFLARFSEVDDG